MAKIKPFKGFFYNPAKIPELGKVVCPPYDVIDTEAQDYYSSLSPYNMVHLILRKDIEGQDKYFLASQYLNKWIEEKILIPDEKQSIYFYLQEYKLKGEKKLRLGFIGLLSLDSSKGNIFSHEYTHIEPKEDRFSLLKAVRANLSPIFVLFQDKHRIIKRLYDEAISSKKPFIELKDKDSIHRLFKIQEPNYLKMLQDAMEDRDIFIADGHHRYEVALAYRDYMRQQQKVIESESDFEYIMAYFTNVESKGLVILAVHRFVKGINLDDSNLKDMLFTYFDIEEIKEKSKFFFYLEKSGLTQNTIGLYRNKHFFLLRLKNVKILDKMLIDKPKLYCRLDISILNHLIFERILNIKPDDKERIIFSYDRDALIQQADSDKRDMVFFLNPIKVEYLVSLAAKGWRLPPKTTYFYPKLLSGLIINKHT
ncbi:MAG: DUF1015 domain-containing protein [Candidatus Omnitrophica bacterium]|nr:DUF1015 domain-containing protein [Candidatus Omnitrophota bacterium]MCM8799493.1 DUF1015 domain-containing protein [Candidatus Omnitrophota bacterium]